MSKNIIKVNVLTRPLHYSIIFYKNGNRLILFEECVIIKLRIKNNYFICIIVRKISCSLTTVLSEIKYGKIFMYRNHIKCGRLLN